MGDPMQVRADGRLGCRPPQENSSTWRLIQAHKGEVVGGGGLQKCRTAAAWKRAGIGIGSHARGIHVVEERLQR